jgi:hypothetical protein
MSEEIKRYRIYLVRLWIENVLNYDSVIRMIFEYKHDLSMKLCKN